MVGNEDSGYCQVNEGHGGLASDDGPRGDQQAQERVHGLMLSCECNMLSQPRYVFTIAQNLLLGLRNIYRESDKGHNCLASNDGPPGEQRAEERANDHTPSCYLSDGIYYLSHTIARNPTRR